MNAKILLFLELPRSSDIFQQRQVGNLLLKCINFAIDSGRLVAALNLYEMFLSNIATAAECIQPVVENIQEKYAFLQRESYNFSEEEKIEKNITPFITDQSVGEEFEALFSEVMPKIITKLAVVSGPYLYNVFNKS